MEIEVILNTTEQSELAQCETIISLGIETFVKVGEALATIRDKRLYRQDYSTFEDYCQNRWDFSRQRAKQLIDSTQVYNNLSTTGLQILPTSERQTRSLSQLPPAQQPQAWQRSVEASGNGQPSARTVERVVREIKPITKQSQTQHKPKASVGLGGFSQVNRYDDMNQAGSDNDFNQDNGGGNEKRVKGFALEELLVMLGEFDDGKTCPYCGK